MSEEDRALLKELASAIRAQTEAISALAASNVALVDLIASSIGDAGDEAPHAGVYLDGSKIG